MNSSLADWPRGFLLHSRQGFTWVNSSLAERFFIVLSVGIHLGEFFLGREVYLDFSWPRSFSLYSRQGFTWVNSSLAERFTSNSLGREVYLGSCINDLPENFS